MARRWRRVSGARWRFMATEKGAVWRWWDGARVWTEAAHHHIAASITRLMETLIPVEADVLAAPVRALSNGRLGMGRGEKLTSDKLLEAADDAATSAYTTHIRAAQPFATSRALEAVRKLLPGSESTRGAPTRDGFVLVGPRPASPRHSERGDRPANRATDSPRPQVPDESNNDREWKDVPPTTDVLALWKPFGPPGTAGHKMLSLIAGLALTAERPASSHKLLGRRGAARPLQSRHLLLLSAVTSRAVRSPPLRATPLLFQAEYVEMIPLGAPSPN